MRAIDGDALESVLEIAISGMKTVMTLMDAEDDPEMKMELKAYKDILKGVKELPTVEPKAVWHDLIQNPKDMPEEREKITMSGRTQMTSDIVDITVEYPDGTRRVDTAFTYRGIWIPNSYPGEAGIVAWKERPVPYGKEA